MSLSLQSRTVGDITVVACAGRIIEGEESATLDAGVSRLFPSQPHVVLDLGGVAFVDSAGFGLLVRLRNRARAAGGDLKICAVSGHLRDVLRITKLDTILPAHGTAGDAITAFYARVHAAEMPWSFEVDILCVHPSPDVLAYLREFLRRAGYGVTTATNLTDARTLRVATTPKVVVIASELASSGAPDEWAQGVADAARVVHLPAGFSTDDAGAAARQLLDEVGGAMVG